MGGILKEILENRLEIEWSRSWGILECSGGLLAPIGIPWSGVEAVVASYGRPRGCESKLYTRIFYKGVIICSSHHNYILLGGCRVA